MSIVRWKIVAAATGMLALAACSGGPTRIKGTPPPPAVAASNADEVLSLLMQGDVGGARKKLKAITKREPANPTAQLLNDSIARDPEELLGPNSYPYVVRPGDTVVGLSQRFLGNRFKAYQLLRYNKLKAPAALTTGQILRLPGEPPRPEPVRRVDSPPPRVAPAPTPTAPKPKVVAPKPVASAANPAAARQLRTAGLAALNQGSVDRAVSLLGRASKLDPGNAIITRDLARAQRIAATVKARK